MSYYRFCVICLLASHLLSCQANDSSPSEERATAQSICGEGYFLDHGHCLEVGPGYKSAKDGMTREACGPGTYSSIATATECTPCTQPLHAKETAFSSQDSALSSDSCSIDKLTCESGFAAEDNSCFAISYSATWSTPANSLRPCDGSQTVSQTLSECSKHFGKSVVTTDNSDCSGLTAPLVTLVSPAGSISEAVTNGTQTRTCPEGKIESEETAISCLGGYFLNGTTCEAVGPGYFSQSGHNKRERCPAGTFSEITNASSCTSCSNLGPHMTKATYSSLDSGLTTNSCRYAFITCETGYAKDANSMACFEETYTPVWAPPADPGLTACGGSKVLSASLQSCIRTFMGTSATVSNSYCFKASPPQTTFLSPPGTKTMNITGGTQSTECAAGANTGSVSRQCLERYSDTGVSCVETCGLPDPPAGTLCLDGTFTLGRYNGTRFKVTPSGCTNGPQGCTGSSDNQIVSLNNAMATNSICSGKVAFAANNWTIPSQALLQIMMAKANQLGGISPNNNYLSFELESCGSVHKSMDTTGQPRPNETCLSGTAFVRCVRSY